ncbi:sarcosine oxidase subunit gamma [Roseibium sp. SCP14]|uniref:sarcosine oxidase subunit gamma n=1 Tax=Roseibium sp. SCP14 TaxID=3141375 RepID=UPI00333C03F7
MSEYRLTPTPALGQGNSVPEKVATYELEENRSLALASVAARSTHGEEVAANLAALLGSAVPQAGTLVEGEDHVAFWIGPDQWMVAASHDDHELLARELKERFGDTASVTEQNDGWVCLDVTGSDLPVVFERLAAVDAQTLEAGSAVRTVIEHVGCFLLCLEKDRHYRLFAGRSFAHSFHHAILTALKSTVAIQETHG